MSNQFVDCGAFQNSDFKWTHSANWLLINSYLELKDEFRDPTSRKKELWSRVADKFRENGYEIPFELLDKKFRNLRATYYQVRERKRHSANKQIKWEYYKVFEDLIQEEEAAVANAAATTSVIIEGPIPVQDDPRLANFRSSVYVPVNNSRKRRRTPNKSPRETEKLVDIEPIVDGMEDDSIEETEKTLINGDSRFKDIIPIDGTIMEESQDGTFEEDDEEYEDDVSANYDMSTKKINLGDLEARKIRAETRYFQKKADYFEKQTLCLDVQRKLMIIQAHKLKLEIERMKSEKRNNEHFAA